MTQHIEIEKELCSNNFWSFRKFEITNLSSSNWTLVSIGLLCTMFETYEHEIFFKKNKQSVLKKGILCSTGITFELYYGTDDQISLPFQQDGWA